LLFLGLGEYSVILDKPLCLISEERDYIDGVKVQSLATGGNSELSEVIAPCDVLIKVNDQTATSFDPVLATSIKECWFKWTSLFEFS